MKDKYYFIIYARKPTHHFSGILGEIEMHNIQFLFAGGKYIIEEEYDGDDPIRWYKSVLEEQGIYVMEHKQQIYKKKNYIWFEIDTGRTNIAEFTQASEIEEEDTETLGWRSIHYPCFAGTKKECLGFAVSARDECVQRDTKALKMIDVLEAIL